MIGHRRDPSTRSPTPACSPRSCPNARLLEASSIIELRVAPERLTDEIADFIDECWQPRRRRRGATRKAS